MHADTLPSMLPFLIPSTQQYPNNFFADTPGPAACNSNLGGYLLACYPTKIQSPAACCVLGRTAAVHLRLLQSGRTLVRQPAA